MSSVSSEAAGTPSSSQEAPTMSSVEPAPSLASTQAPATSPSPSTPLSAPQPPVTSDERSPEPAPSTPTPPSPTFRSPDQTVVITTTARGEPPVVITLRPTRRPSAGDEGLSSGALAGVIAGSVIGGLLLLGLLIFCLYRSRARSRFANSERDYSDAPPSLYQAPIVSPIREKGRTRPVSGPLTFDDIYRPANTPGEPIKYRPPLERQLSNPYSAIAALATRRTSEPTPSEAPTRRSVKRVRR